MVILVLLRWLGGVVFCDWVGILVVFHICDADFYLDFGRFIFVMGWWKIMGIDNQIDMIFYDF